MYSIIEFGFFLNASHLARHWDALQEFFTEQHFSFHGTCFRLQAGSPILPFSGLPNEDPRSVQEVSKLRPLLPDSSIGRLFATILMALAVTIRTGCRVFRIQLHYSFTTYQIQWAPILLTNFFGGSFCVVAWAVLKAGVRF
jgi:hypothetical protein